MMIDLDLMPQAGQELTQGAGDGAGLVDRGALGDTDPEPAVEPVAPQVVLAEDVADMRGIEAKYRDISRSTLGRRPVTAQ